MNTKKLGKLGLLFSVLAIVCDICSDSINEKLTEKMIDDKVEARFRLEKQKEVNTNEEA